MGDLALSLCDLCAYVVKFTRTTCLEFHTFDLPVLYYK